MSLQTYVTPKMFFKWSEFTVSRDFPQEARKIVLTPEHRARILLWVQACGDPWRMTYKDYPLIITSGVRSPVLNGLVRGSKDSDHLYGNAVDCHIRGMSAASFFCSIVEMQLPYRELIFYPDMKIVHWSINVPGRTYKREVKAL